MAGTHDTIGAHLERSGVSRRHFLEFCGKLMVAAPAGLALTQHAWAQGVADALSAARRPSVVWLHFQDCTGCTETLLRTASPDLSELIFDLISLDYHETVMAAAGHQAEAALQKAMTDNEGQFICVVEGSIPEKNGGIYMKLAGKPATKVLEEVASKAAAVVSIGSCASWGGIPSAAPNPTGATGVDSLVKNKPVVNIPGCPPNPYTFLAVVLQYAVAGTLPKLDGENRPEFAYGRLIHEHCPRRAHFDAGRFAEEFGSESHRAGWCLYKLGCKGPVTHAACSTRHFNDVVDAWPIGIGAPCFGCTERTVAFKAPYREKAPIYAPTPPSTYPNVDVEEGEIDPWATGIVGGAVGSILGGTWVAARRFSAKPTEIPPPPAGHKDLDARIAANNNQDQAAEEEE